MLRKRTRSVLKDQQMGHLIMSDGGSESSFPLEGLGQNHKSNSFFNVTGLFVGLSPKGLLDSDSVRSPTSPLDFRMFSNRGNPVRSPRSSFHDGNQKSWAKSKVGLSIVDSLDDDDDDAKVSKEVLVGPVLRIKTPNSFESPKSLPKNFAIFPQTQIKSPLQKCDSGVLFEIGTEHLGKPRSSSLDSGRSLSGLSGLTDHNPNSGSGNLCLENVSTQVTSPKLIEGSRNSNNFLNESNGSVNGLFGSLSASEIELSEDYTCVISHGPNPKTTHIYGDCILECHTNHLSNTYNKEEVEFGLPKEVDCLDISNPFAANYFLSICSYCNKKLEEGKDIYIYRGEKAFCSLNCRAEEILMDEEMEETANAWSENSPESDHSGGLFETGIFITT